MDSLDFLKLFLRFSYIILFLPLTIGAFGYKALSKDQKLIFLFVIATFVNDSLSLLLKVLHETNLWVYHFFVPVSFVIVLRVYAHHLSRNLFVNRTFNIVSLTFVALAVINSVWVQKLDDFNSNMISLSSFIYMILAIRYFYRLIKTRKQERLEREPMVWFNTGVLLYHSGSLILFLFVNNLIDGSPDLLLSSWWMNAILNVMLIVFNAIALWVKPQL